MLTKCQGIVLRVIQYSETSVIVKCYTDVYGLQSYLINGVRKNKGAIRPSQLMPLNLLQLEVYHQHNKNLQRIKELKCEPTLTELHFNMVKSAIAMFMSEVIYRAIKEENQPDEELFKFLFQIIQWVDEEKQSLANFPVCFLVQLSRFLGFYPKSNIEQASVFNVKDGLFEERQEGNPFQAEASISQALALILDKSFEEQMQTAFAASVRKSLLVMLVEYYNQHVSGFANMQSHTILAEVLE